MGAASNFGKAPEIDINSPTHRNTHNEELFSPNNNNTKKNNNSTASSTTNNLIDDLFSSSPAPESQQPEQYGYEEVDDFDPRSEEKQEFGDFNSAFGNAPTTAVPPTTNRPKPPSISAGDDEFADFSAAFTGGADHTSHNNHNHQQNVTTNNTNDLLFNANSVNPINNQSLNIDLFGGNLNTISSPSPSSNTLAADLLSDFGGLSMNTSNGESFFLYN